jgi:copper chaperone
MMLELQVSGMTCGHCEKAVTRAVHSVDPAATIKVDRSAGRVSAETDADPQVVKQAIEAEGYTVESAGA